MTDYPGYTSPNAPQQSSAAPPPHHTPPGEPEQKKPRNTVGMVALVTALIGFIFACIPGALIVGWVLLPIAFVLSIVGLAQSGKPKKTSIAAIIISIVGFIVGVLVFMFAVGTAIEDAFGEQEPEIISPAAEDSEGDAGGEGAESAGEEGAESGGDADGSRSNPVALGSTIRGEVWDVAIISFEPDATAEVLKANEFNEEPGEGNVYALVEAQATYTGEDSEHPWVDLSFAYVTEGGNTINSYDSPVVAPSPQFDDIGELYEGGSGSGFIVFEIPEGDEGLLRITPGFFADDVFVEAK